MTHNLNIHMYSLTEILGLFDLKYDISVEDLKRAKKKVLMTHPDKSGLAADYFLFYKKAFDIVIQFYDNQQKQNRAVPTEETKYQPMKADLNSSSVKKVGSVIKDMTPKDFNQKFNQLFDQNMAQKQDPKRNEWFSKDDPNYQIDGQVNKQNMGQMFDKIKESQSVNALAQYRGVQNLYVNSGSGAKLYDDVEDDCEYVECDPFSKLKFDDLRKVHKDQTVLAVSERDFQKVKQYSSVDHMMRERGGQSLTPLEKVDAEKLLSMQDKQYRERMMQKEYQATLKSMEYAEKNKVVMSSFLQLK